MHLMKILRDMDKGGKNIIKYEKISHTMRVKKIYILLFNHKLICKVTQLIVKITESKIISSIISNRVIIIIIIYKN